jgi:hypothetical protein
MIPLARTCGPIVDKKHALTDTQQLNTDYEPLLQSGSDVDEFSPVIMFTEAAIGASYDILLKIHRKHHPNGPLVVAIDCKPLRERCYLHGTH